jgi:hypothetical protein
MRALAHTLPFYAQVIGANALLLGARAWYGLTARGA